MSLQPFAYLRRFAKPGMAVELTIVSHNGQELVRGVITEIEDSGALLVNGNALIFVSKESVGNFKIFSEGVPAATIPVASPIPVPLVAVPPVVPAPAVAMPIAFSPAKESLNGMDALFGQFQGPVTIRLPQPSFVVAGLTKEQQQELNRWKCKYDYAIKVKEMGRVHQFYHEVARFADQVQRAELYMVTGLLALMVDDPGLARSSFEKGLAEQGHESALGLAHLAALAAQPDWAKIAEYLCRACHLQQEPSESDSDLMVTLGRCLSNMDNREVQGLVVVTAAKVSEKAQTTARLLLAYALSKAHPRAADEAYRGKLDLAHSLAPDSPVFKPLPPVIKQTQTLLPRIPLKRVLPEVSRYRGADTLMGHITLFYRDKAYGYLVDDVSQRTFFFHGNDVKDQALTAKLGQQQNPRGVRVSFTPQLALSSAQRYDKAIDLRLQIDKPEAAVAAPAPPRAKPAATRAQPARGDSAYVRAKRAEQAGDLAAAEAGYRQEINDRGRYRPSAIKDLAQLINRLNRSEEAIALLDRHRNEFDDKRSLDNQKAVFLIKTRRYVEAAALFDSIQKGARQADRLIPARNQAYCLFMQSRFDDALECLERIRRQWPYDTVTTSLIDRVKAARESGLRVGEDEELLELAGFSSGLSPFAEFILDKCELVGVDERSKARGFFEERDFHQVDQQLDQLRGRLPRQKAELFLSLAAMCRKAPEAAGERNLPDLLRSCFAFLGEAAISENLHTDTARCYLAEALYLARREHLENMPLAYLLSTYLSSPPAFGELIGSDGRIHVDAVLKRFESDPNGWAKVEKAFPYYSTMSVLATQTLMQKLAGNKELKNFLTSQEEIELARTEERERVRAESAALEALADKDQTISAGWLQDARTTFNSYTDSTRFDLDRQRLRTLARITGEAATYWLEKDYVEREAKHGRLRNDLQQLAHEILRSSTKLSVETLLPFCERLSQELDADFERFKEAAKPSLMLDNVLRDAYYIPDEHGKITVKLELASASGGPPVEGLSIDVLPDNGLTVEGPCPSPEVLRGGERREIKLEVRPAPSQLADLAFTLRARLAYRTRSGEDIESTPYTLPIRIGAADSFQPIPNPYLAYSGGSVVADPAMFFGRKDLLAQIHEQVTTGPLGQCFVLYGQKRSGKSSVLRQLNDQISRESDGRIATSLAPLPPYFTVMVTIGAMDTQDGEKNFIKMCLDTVREKITDELALAVPEWPSFQDVKDRPTESFRTALRQALRILTQAGWSNPRIIFLVDEFTYLYEYIKEKIVSPAFMRQWKALLQMELFSAVVVGQDSMPKFIREYTNEFGVTHKVRISYLSEAEAHELAVRPILFNGESRYRGKALEKLLKLTAGSPFYLQIVCDHLVRHLNVARAPFITEADIDHVTNQLISGPERLSIERFDPLITAAGESVSEASRETYIHLLTVIAKTSDWFAGARKSDLPELEDGERLMTDLKDREVLEVDAGGRISIRVGMFAEWLRYNV